MMGLSQAQVGSNLPLCIKTYRIGSEKREIFGSELKNSVAPGPGIYDLTKGVGFVKGKNSPRITMGTKFTGIHH